MDRILLVEETSRGNSEVFFWVENKAFHLVNGELISASPVITKEVNILFNFNKY